MRPQKCEAFLTIFTAKPPPAPPPQNGQVRRAPYVLSFVWTAIVWIKRNCNTCWCAWQWIVYISRKSIPTCANKYYGKKNPRLLRCCWWCDVELGRLRSLPCISFARSSTYTALSSSRPPATPPTPPLPVHCKNRVHSMTAVVDDHWLSWFICVTMWRLFCGQRNDNKSDLIRPFRYHEVSRGKLFSWLLWPLKMYSLADRWIHIVNLHNHQVIFPIDIPNMYLPHLLR